MQISKNEITKIILEEIRDVLQEQDRTKQNTGTARIIAAAEKAAGYRLNSAGKSAVKRYVSEKPFQAGVDDTVHAKEWGLLARPTQQQRKFRAKSKKRRNRGARRYSSRGIRNKAARQERLIKYMNRDKGRAALKKQLGKDYTGEVNLKDIQTALGGIRDKNVLRYIKKAKPGIYDANTYRAIVAFQKKFRSELQDKRLDGLMGPSTYGVLLSKDPVLQKKATTKGLAITSTTGFGAHDKIANAKPGRERFEMMKDLADVNPAAFKEFKDSVLMNLKKESKQRLQNLRDFSKLDRNQKQGIRAEFEKEITNSKVRSAKLTQLYKDLRRVKSSLKKDVKRTATDNESLLKKNAAKLGFKNLTQVNMALDYMRKDRDLQLIDAIKKAGVKPPKNAMDIINNFGVDTKRKK